MGKLVFEIPCKERVNASSSLQEKKMKKLRQAPGTISLWELAFKGKGPLI